MRKVYNYICDAYYICHPWPVISKTNIEPLQIFLRTSEFQVLQQSNDEFEMLSMYYPIEHGS